MINNRIDDRHDLFLNSKSVTRANETKRAIGRVRWPDESATRLAACVSSDHSVGLSAFRHARVQTAKLLRFTISKCPTGRSSRPGYRISCISTLRTRLSKSSGTPPSLASTIRTASQLSSGMRCAWSRYTDPSKAQQFFRQRKISPPRSAENKASRQSHLLLAQRPSKTSLLTDPTRHGVRNIVIYCSKYCDIA